MDVWMGRDEGSLDSETRRAPGEASGGAAPRMERDLSKSNARATQELAPAAAPASSLKEEKGAVSIRVAKKIARMKNAGASDDADATGVGRAGSGIRTVGARTFMFDGGRWVDTAAADAKDAPEFAIKYGSEAYFKVLSTYPELARCASLGKAVELMFRGKRVKIAEADGQDTITDDALKAALGAP